MTTITVAVCTYRRPALLASSLASIEEQRLPIGVEIDVLVVDNDPASSARSVVENFAATSRHPVRYVAHGATNIASARNRVLESVTPEKDFLAILDDDETADPDWIAELLLAQHETGADVVTGPVLAIYPPTAPAWLRSDAFYSVIGPDVRTEVHEAVTGNALMRMSALRRQGARFDTDLGMSGGEDQLFFRTIAAAGYRLWFAPGAVVREVVPLDRLSTRYLARREFRKGNTLGLLDRSRPGWPSGHPGRRLASSIYWVVSGGAQAVVGCLRGNPTAAAAGALRVARAAGMVAGLVGRTFHLYGRPTSGSGPTVALVVPEAPGYQRAGHAQYLDGFVNHYLQAGVRVVLVVTEGKLGFLAHRSRPGSPSFRAPGLVTVGPWQVVIAPGTAVRWAAWSAFRHAPRLLQTRVDGLRTRVRGQSQVDHRLGSFLSDIQATAVERALHREQPDAVLFSGIFSLLEPDRLPASVKARVLINHDVVSERAADLRARGYRVAPADLTPRSEAEAMRAATAIVAIQWDDAEAFRRMVPGTDVIVSPVAMRSTVDPTPEVRGRLLFVGSGSLPNLDGLRWFVEEVWPALRRRVPDAHLDVVGTVCARFGETPDGVHLRGEVADLGPEYASAAVVIVPLRTGSGLKVKLVEAICHGTAIVTTPTGAQGLHRLEPRPYVCADDAATFGTAVAELLEDSASRAQVRAAAGAAAETFSPDRAYTQLDHHLRERGVIA